MSTQNVISYALSTEEKTAINSALTALETSTGKFVVALTPEQKNGLAKPGTNYLPLIDKAARVPDRFPQVLPPTFDNGEFTKDLTLRNDLTAFRDRLIKLSESIDNTLFAVNSDCFAESLKVYGFVEANKESVPGINQLAAEMEAFFTRSARVATTTPAATTTTTK
jgi:hypothetical protein